MKNLIFAILLFPICGFAQDVNQSNSILENLNVINQPFTPLSLNEDIKIDQAKEQQISEESLKYVDSPNFAESKEQIEIKLNNQDAECMDETSKIACLNGRADRFYQEYKIKNFLDGIYNQAKLENIKLNDDLLFSLLEKDMNQHKDKNGNGQPDILILIDNQNIESNLILKLISYKCSTDNKDTSSYLKCIVDLTNKSENIFLKVKTKCIVKAAENNKSNTNTYLETCINREMLENDVIKWISFQAYRLGSIYLEINKDELIEKK